MRCDCYGQIGGVLAEWIINCTFAPAMVAADTAAVRDTPAMIAGRRQAEKWKRKE